MVGRPMLSMPMPSVFAIVIVPELVRVLSFTMPSKLLESCILIVPPELLVMVAPIWFEMPLPPVFAIVIVPELVRVPELTMPELLPEFCILIVPPELLVMVPMLSMP